jgi:AhpD family alkylhydroperoxidase
MQARLDIMATELGPKLVKYFVASHRAITESSVPEATLNLVDIRASQINGCAPCLDMHTKEAIAAGETSVRLNLVACWREASVFTEAERAALELAEQGTRLADSAGVDEDVWRNAAKHYDEEQLAALVAQIALINTFNRLNVITRQVGGSYQAGQLG